MLKVSFYLLVLTSLTSCADHPYETDGHNSVQLPDGFDEDFNTVQDSLSIESEQQQSQNP